MYKDRKDLERKNEVRTTSKLNDLGDSHNQGQEEIDKLEVNVCQCRDLLITQFWFMLHIEETQWGVMNGVVPIEIASDDSITSVSE